jgi:hypothetical protein
MKFSKTAWLAVVIVDAARMPLDDAMLTSFIPEDRNCRLSLAPKIPSPLLEVPPHAAA